MKVRQRIGDWSLFWKKKSEAEAELEAVEQDSDLRDDFRIAPDPENPVIVTVNQVDIRVANISAGGLAFRAKGFEVNREYSIRLQLPDGAAPILTTLRVMFIDERHVCRGKFVRLSLLSKDIIHRYVLGREKHRIRTTHMRRIVTDDDLKK